jgi:hypothetical protein
MFAVRPCRSLYILKMASPQCFQWCVTTKSVIRIHHEDLLHPSIMMMQKGKHCLKPFDCSLPGELPSRI